MGGSTRGMGGNWRGRGQGEEGPEGVWEGGGEEGLGGGGLERKSTEHLKCIRLYNWAKPSVMKSVCLFVCTGIGSSNYY